MLPASDKQTHLDAHLDGKAAFEACETGDNKTLKGFLDHGGSPMALNELGDTLLHAAVRGGNPANVRMLLERDADPTTKNSMLDIPLQVSTALPQRGALACLFACACVGVSSKKRVCAAV